MPKKYTVQTGECVSSIAFENGFFWQTIWDHPENLELKQLRTNPNILKEGDVLTIPDKRQKQVSCATDKRHPFKLKGVPAKLRLRIMEPPKPENKPVEDATGSDDISHVEDPDFKPETVEDVPVKNAFYNLEIDGKLVKSASTDDDGRIEISVPPNAREGKLILNPGTAEERIMPLALGSMDPITETSGFRMRLANLGYPCNISGEDDSDDLSSSLRRFQQDNQLDITGRIDDATRNKLKQLHGS
ncbi:peptidoglycan-binding domain-containing protein [Methylomonas sp. AM2-LC]|uniref:PGRP and LysM peptidoglycan-binding domain-containing protein n=1 Tax=Methylomonas sp. AM2-LC TaxID=3153301 RepID=UPI003263DB92